MPLIRPLERADVEPANALARRSFEAASEQPDFAVELERVVARAWIATSPPEEGRRLVGYALGWLVADDVEIMSVAVEPSERGRGIGRALLTRLLEGAWREGARNALLEVRASNASARALYERLGFERIGVRRRYYADAEDAVSYRMLEAAFPRGGDER